MILGFSFTIPLFSWFIGARCGAYVHFPTVSTDMVNRVVQQSTATSYNNSSRIRNSQFLTTLKKLYYIIFKWIYGWTGSSMNCHAVAVNSTWTMSHIVSLFGSQPIILYPPCPCLVNEKGEGEKRKPWIISIGQFRPEKNHLVSHIVIVLLIVNIMAPLHCCSASNFCFCRYCICAH